MPAVRPSMMRASSSGGSSEAPTDRKTEDIVFQNLQDYAKDKVVFLISHRLYHFPQMQQVVFLDGGKPTVGTHDALMASVPVYRQL